MSEEKSIAEILTGKKAEGGIYFIPEELHKKIEDHAKQKGISVDQEATELLELAINAIEFLVAAKNVMKGGDMEL